MGYPSVSSDPVTGFGMEEVDIILENGKKKISFYSPYVYRISADIYQSSVGLNIMGIDLPYFKESPYRINFYSFYVEIFEGNTMESAIYS